MLAVHGCRRAVVAMAARIPLSVPDGACATPLSWNQEDTNEEHGDQAWIVEVEVAGKSSSTSLEFGKVSLERCWDAIGSPL